MEAQGVSGYEDEVRRCVRDLLPRNVTVEEDALGNLVVRLGQGSPRILVTAPLDEPGYVVSGFTPDGYLRLNRVGRSVETPLADQFIEGQRVTIGTHRGRRVGVVACRSTHLHRDRDEKRAPFSIDDAYVDVGARTASEAEVAGFRLLDPVTRAKEAVTLGPDRLTAPAAANRACVAALVQAIRELSATPPKSEIVFAFLAQEELGRKGIDAIANRFKADRSYLLVGDGFGIHRTSSRTTDEVEKIPLGTGVLIQPAKGTQGLDSLLKRAQSRGIPAREAPHDPLAPSAYTGGPPLPPEHTFHFGIPSLYGGTPVECIDRRDVEALGRLIVLLGEEEAN